MQRFFTSLLSLLLIFSFTASPALAAKDGFSKGATSGALRDQYDTGKIKILIAAGHEPGYGGAVYQGVYEREIVVDIADELERLLEQNPHYEVVVTRDNDSWNKDLSKYFKKKKKSIQSFIKKQKKVMKKLLRKQDEEEGTDAGVQHATAAPDAALRLYGINKWANENDVDLVVNLHINDAPDHGPDQPSAYTGYAIYVPDKIYGNAQTSMELGRTIAKKLNALSDESTLPGESAGVVPDRELIAMGAFGTLNVPSVLVEYGYISEPRFTLPEYRETVTKDTAYQTYLAIQDFFKDPVENPRDVTKLPTEWPKPEPVPLPPVATTTPPVVEPPVSPPVVATTSPAAPVACAPFTQTILPMKDGDKPDPTGAVQRLQTILALDTTVYPEGLVTGFYGPATQRAVERFQAKHDIVSSGTPETTGYGAVGPRTAKMLLVLCSS